MRIYFQAFILALAFCPGVRADSQPLKLDDYRLKALLPAVCTQMGGTVVYATHGNDCKLPTVTSSVPSSAVVGQRATPLSARH